MDHRPAGSILLPGTWLCSLAETLLLRRIAAVEIGRRGQKQLASWKNPFDWMFPGQMQPTASYFPLYSLLGDVPLENLSKMVHHRARHGVNKRVKVCHRAVCLTRFSPGCFEPRATSLPTARLLSISNNPAPPPRSESFLLTFSLESSPRRGFARVFK